MKYRVWEDEACDWTDVLNGPDLDGEDMEPKDCAKALLAHFRTEVETTEDTAPWRVKNAGGNEENGVAWVTFGPDTAGILVWGYAAEFMSTAV
jgi:hypothetical protein